MDINKIKEKIRDYFKKKREITAVYLYGSYARGEEGRDSDMDLAVLIEDKVKNKLPLTFDYQNDLEKELALGLDIQLLNNIGIELGKRIIDEGELLYENDKLARVYFTVNILNKYFDMQPFYDEYYQLLSQRALEGKFNDRF